MDYLMSGFKFKAKQWILGYGQYVFFPSLEK